MEDGERNQVVEERQAPSQCPTVVSTVQDSSLSPRWLSRCERDIAVVLGSASWVVVVW